MESTLRPYWPVFRAAAALFVTAVGVATAFVPVHAVQSVAETRVLFVSDRQKAGDYAIYSMKADGSDQTRISKEDGIFVDPSWSPDHKRILCSRVTGKEQPGATLVVMNADGTGAMSLVPAEEQAAFLTPSWSPDGKHIVFCAMKTAPEMSGIIYITGPDGKNRTKVADGMAPVWAPDSLHLVISPVPKSKIPSLQLVDLNGANVKTLAEEGMGASWSPDGKRIAFTGSSNDLPALFVMDADGRHVTKLTRNPDALAIGPVWTPDGKHILFSQLPKSSADKPELAIWMVDLDGGNARAVTGKNSFLGVGASLVFVMRSAASNP